MTRTSFHLLRTLGTVTLPLALLTALAAGPAPAAAAERDATQQDGFSAGLSVQRMEDAAKTGLPVYPGAQLLRDKGERGDEGGAGGSVGIWGGPFGFQLHALKLQSRDPLPTVAAFYKAAMARDGNVIDCSQPQPEPPAAERGKDNLLRCGSDKPAPGGQLFKVGTPKRVRMVALEPLAGGTRIQLLRIELKGD
jgi:hypothetical protein